MRFLILVLSAWLMAVPVVDQASAGMIGSSVRVTNEYPSLGNALESFGPLTVANGTVVESLGLGASLTFSDDSILLTNLTAGAFVGPGFNGFVVSFLSGFTPTSATVTASSIASLVPVIDIFGSDLRINLAGKSGGAGDTVTISVTSGRSVPEPTGIALFGAGLLGFGIARRRRA